MMERPVSRRAGAKSLDRRPPARPQSQAPGDRRAGQLAAERPPPVAAPPYHQKPPPLLSTLGWARAPRTLGSPVNRGWKRRQLHGQLCPRTRAWGSREEPCGCEAGPPWTHCSDAHATRSAQRGDRGQVCPSLLEAGAHPAVVVIRAAGTAVLAVGRALRLREPSVGALEPRAQCVQALPSPQDAEPGLQGGRQAWTKGGSNTRPQPALSPGKESAALGWRPGGV